MNGYYECNMTTGKLNRIGEYTISLTAEIDSVHSESGLAVDLLGGGDEGGYRVFYHNEERQMKMMSYTDDTNWIDGGTVSQDSADGIAIGTVYFDKKNMTVAFPKGTDNVETTRLMKSGKWKLGMHSHIPFSGLEAITDASQLLSHKSWRVITQTKPVQPRSA